MNYSNVVFKVSNPQNTSPVIGKLESEEESMCNMTLGNWHWKMPIIELPHNPLVLCGVTFLKTWHLWFQFSIYLVFTTSTILIKIKNRKNDWIKTYFLQFLIVIILLQFLQQLLFINRSYLIHICPYII